jgi:hypothetical protein
MLPAACWAWLLRFDACCCAVAALHTAARHLAALVTARCCESSPRASSIAPRSASAPTGPPAPLGGGRRRCWPASRPIQRTRTRPQPSMQSRSSIARGASSTRRCHPTWGRRRLLPGTASDCGAVRWGAGTIGCGQWRRSGRCARSSRHAWLPSLRGRRPHPSKEGLLLPCVERDQLAQHVELWFALSHRRPKALQHIGTVVHGVLATLQLHVEVRAQFLRK